MRLAVDAGNTRIKWVLGDGVSQAVMHHGRDPAGLLAELWGQLPRPDAVHVACVGPEVVRKAIAREAGVLWPEVPLVFLSSRAAWCGVRIGYDRPERFGVDRMAALVAAHAEAANTPVVVVDAGTAVTVDALDVTGGHLGGLIMPGLRLLRESLHQGTAGVQVGLFAAEEAGAILQHSTEGGVSMGARCMFVGGVRRAVDLACSETGTDVRIYLSGGDAPLLSAMLGREHVVRPDLVLEGVARMARDA